jgi:uncharacterized protein YgiB involved in biofilm formation
MEPGSKKSVAVPLVLMGAFAGSIVLPMVFSGTDVQRNKYTSREACVADYSETQCNPDRPVGGSGLLTAAALAYYGPWYRSDYRTRNDANDPGPGRYYRGGATSGFSSGGAPSSAPTSVETGSRGGFGRSGRVSARGG